MENDKGCRRFEWVKFRYPGRACKVPVASEMALFRAGFAMCFARGPRTCDSRADAVNGGGLAGTLDPESLLPPKMC